MHYTVEQDGWIVSTDPELLDLDAIHAFLSKAYWCEGIPRQTMSRAMANSLCFGLYRGSEQAGLARVVTDRATFAYLCDVYVVDQHRGGGLGSWLIDCVMRHPDLRSLRRFNLATRDAHQLYKKHGFGELARPQSYMETLKHDLYRDSKTSGVAGP